MVSVSLTFAQTKEAIVKEEIAKPATVTDAVETKVTGPKMTFEFKNYDYGTIVQNSDGVREFPFVNDGTEPLIIKHAKGSCGCTVPEYAREPIMPGDESVIKVKYDTKRLGPFSKSVRITTNVSDQPIVITIKGKVEQEPAGLPEKAQPGLGSMK